MPMSVSFRWRTPQIVTPQSMAEKTNLGDNLAQAGNAILAARTRSRQNEERARAEARQTELDRMNSEDRQRRIQAEDRQQKLYGETSELIRSKAAQRAELVRRREEIVNRINELEQRIGG